MTNTVAVILAAGKGTRMKSDTPKVLHKILGKTIIDHILDNLRAAGIKDIITVVGHGAGLLKRSLKGTTIVVQKDLSGSASAVRAAKGALKRYPGNILIICGDTPLIGPNVIEGILKRHKASGASLTLLTARVGDPASYGRIVRDAEGRPSRIVEDAEARPHEKAIDEINVGAYCVRSGELFGALSGVGRANNKREFFLTDMVGIMYNKRKTIESVVMDNEEEGMGINTRRDLSEATMVLKRKVLEELMADGVTIEDPSSTVIYPGVKIGRDTVIRSNTVIESNVEIGKHCSIGPFARIRPDVRIGDGVEIGNFVELNRTSIGDKTRIKHHSYLGDAVIGSNVNIGAGTITANYDGKNKNKTVIESGAFIGVGAILIAPVKIGKNSTVGAGSVVPKDHDVPKGATVIGIPARIYNRKGDRR